MQGFFWFFLGGFVYLILDKALLFHKKIQFLTDIKIYSFQLIGMAYEQLVFAMTLKYVSLEDSHLSEEKIKLHKNIDEAAFSAWKKETSKKLKDSIPVVYRDALDIESWDDIMNTLDIHYKKALRSQPLQEESKHVKVKTNSAP